MMKSAMVAITIITVMKKNSNNNDNIIIQTNIVSNCHNSNNETLLPFSKDIASINAENTAAMTAQSIFWSFHKKNDMQLHNDSCAICLDDFINNEKIKLLPCGHGFHSQCIDPWLKLTSELCQCANNLFLTIKINKILLFHPISIINVVDFFLHLTWQIKIITIIIIIIIIIT